MRETRVETASKVADDDLLPSLYSQYAGPLRSIARRLTAGDKDWADDIVQETLVRAWLNAGTLRQRESGSLLPWLATVARRVAIDSVRKRERRPKEVCDEPLYLAGADDVEPMLDSIVVADALASLSATHRQVLVAIYYGGHTIRETAEMFGLPIGTAKTRLHYGLRALRLILQERGVVR